MESRIVAAALVAAAILGACVRVEPKVLDRRMQLENQIIGTLRQLDRRLILQSSVRGETRTSPAPMGPLKRGMVEAAMNRAFNADDIELYKKAGHVGEARDGRLQVLRSPKDRKGQVQLRALVAEENRDRDRILEGLVATSADLAPGDLSLMRTIFFRLMVRTARPGEWVQGKDGRFHRVGKRRSPSAGVAR